MASFQFLHCATSASALQQLAAPVLSTQPTFYSTAYLVQFSTLTSLPPYISILLLKSSYAAFHASMKHEAKSRLPCLRGVSSNPKCNAIITPGAMNDEQNTELVKKTLYQATTRTSAHPAFTVLLYEVYYSIADFF